MEARVLTLENSHCDAEYGALLDLIYQQRSAYLHPLLDLVELTWDQFGQRLRSTGTAYRICLDSELAGVCWVEQRQETLILLGLLVRPENQGQGIGTLVLQRLEQIYAGKAAAIELQVYASNHGAQALYRRCGYRTVSYNDHSRLYTMRKPIGRDHQSN
jgi:ribosomal protein S18 acetylase RimI-like enzyme